MSYVYIDVYIYIYIYTYTYLFSALRWLLQIATNSIFFPTSLYGVLVFDSVSRRLLLRLLLLRRLLRTQHTHLSHTHKTFSTTICHTHTHTSSHIFVTHHFSQSFTHISLSTTIFHTQLCQPPFVTHTHTSLPHIIFHLCQAPSFTHLSHTIFRTHLCRTSSFTYNFVTRNLSFAWQAWRLVTSTLESRGRRPSFHVAGVALGDIHLRFTWQAWHLATCTFVLRGRRGAYRALGWVCGRAWTGLVASDAAALCVAGVALGDTHLRVTWRGRRGTWRHRSFCVAGVPLRALGWLWRRAWTGLVAGDAAALCVAGVSLGDIRLRFTWHWAGSGGALGLDWSPVTPRHFAWQAWRLATSTFVSRGRRGPWRLPPLFHVAGAALGDMHLRFAWQARHLGHWAGSGGALGLDWSLVTPRHFAWQVWHLATSTFVLRGFQWQAYACSSCPSHPPPGQMDSGDAVLQQSSKEQSKPRTERLRKEVYE